MQKALVVQTVHHPVGELSNVFVWACTGYMQGCKAGCAEAEYDRRDHKELGLARLYSWVLLDLVLDIQVLNRQCPCMMRRVACAGDMQGCKAGCTEAENDTGDHRELG